MAANLKILEERVVRTVERLRALTAERNRLRDELGRLETRLSEASRGPDGADGAAGSVRSDEIAAVLRQAVEELREG